AVVVGELAVDDDPGRRIGGCAAGPEAVRRRWCRRIAAAAADLLPLRVEAEVAAQVAVLDRYDVKRSGRLDPACCGGRVGFRRREAGGDAGGEQGGQNGHQTISSVSGRPCRTARHVLQIRTISSARSLKLSTPSRMMRGASAPVLLRSMALSPPE